MTKITIAIPNYKGVKLLKQNLPSIVSVGADEVLINDDFSEDGSVQYIEDNFPQVKLLVSDRNRGFIASVNRLFDQAEGDVVVLLNNDVCVERSFLRSLITHFENDNIFAVNCHEKGEGYSEAFWKDGFFEYQRGQELKDVHKSSWASGGSAAFRKSVWQKLKGFDSIFHPGYWEDIDLSFRAIQQGYQILWEPNAKVLHNHGTTFSKVLKKRSIEWVQQRNQLLFIWKNVSDKKLLSEHRWVLIRRLLGGMGLGYWVPFLWALLKLPNIKKQNTRDHNNNVLSDQEAINYVNG